MNEDLQKYLDEDLLDTTPKRKKESNFLDEVCNYMFVMQLWNCTISRKSIR